MEDVAVHGIRDGHHLLLGGFVDPEIVAHALLRRLEAALPAPDDPMTADLDARALARHRHSSAVPMTAGSSYRSRRRNRDIAWIPLETGSRLDEEKAHSGHVAEGAVLGRVVCSFRKPLGPGASTSGARRGGHGPPRQLRHKRPSIRRGCRSWQGRCRGCVALRQP